MATPAADTPPIANANAAAMVQSAVGPRPAAHADQAACQPKRPRLLSLCGGLITTSEFGAQIVHEMSIGLAGIRAPVVTGDAPPSWFAASRSGPTLERLESQGTNHRLRSMNARATAQPGGGPLVPAPC